MERTRLVEPWMTLPEVEDVLNATNKVLAKAGIEAPPVQFVRPAAMVAAYKNEMLNNHSFYRDFEELGIDLATQDAASLGVGIIVSTPDGPLCLLSNEYFGGVFQDKRQPDRHSSNIITLFAAITTMSLQYASKEIDLPASEALVDSLKSDLHEVIKQMANSAPDPEVVLNYGQDLMVKLQTSPTLKVTGKGQRVMLRDDKTAYINEFHEQEGNALILIEQHLRPDFIREMKKTKWFIHPEKWSKEVTDYYKQRTKKTPGDIGNNVGAFFQDYLSGSLARRGLEILESELTQSSDLEEIDIEPSEQIEHFDEPDASVIVETAKVMVHTEPTEKKKKERKKKIYPNQKEKARRAAEEAQIALQENLRESAMEIIQAYSKISRQEWQAKLEKSYFARKDGELRRSSQKQVEA